MCHPPLRPVAWQPKWPARRLYYAPPAAGAEACAAHGAAGGTADGAQERSQTTQERRVDPGGWAAPARWRASDDEDTHIDDVMPYEHIRRAARREQRPAGLQRLPQLEGGWLGLLKGLAAQLPQAARDQ